MVYAETFELPATDRLSGLLEDGCSVWNVQSLFIVACPDKDSRVLVSGWEPTNDGSDRCHPAGRLSALPRNCICMASMFDGAIRRRHTGQWFRCKTTSLRLSCKSGSLPSACSKCSGSCAVKFAELAAKSNKRSRVRNLELVGVRQCGGSSVTVPNLDWYGWAATFG